MLGDERDFSGREKEKCEDLNDWEEFNAVACQQKY